MTDQLFEMFQEIKDKEQEDSQWFIGLNEQ